MLKNSMYYIYEIYREKSFSKAAKKLYISQPALSAAVQKEESIWNCSFFDRSANPLELTPEGAHLIEAIEQMIAQQHALEDILSEYTQERQNKVNIGATAYFCSHVLPKRLKLFHAANPDCKINIIEATDSDLVQCLQAGTIDICITVEKYTNSNLTSIPIGKEDIVLAVPSACDVNQRLQDKQIDEHAIAFQSRLVDECPKVSISEFQDVPFLLLQKSNDMHSRTLKIFEQASIEPNIIMLVDQVLTSYYMAMAGVGATFSRAGMVNHDCKELCFYALDSEYITRTVNLVHKNSHPLPRMVKQMIAQLSDGSFYS